MAENPQFNKLKQCRHGLMLYNMHDKYVGRSLEEYGEFSHYETLVFEQFLRQGDYAIDIGANIGCHTLQFAKSVGPRGRVLAFEPQRIIYQTLCANMALNSITNAYCYQIGLGDKVTTMKTQAVDYNAPHNFAGLALKTDADGDIVDVLRLDAFNLPRCRLIKVDVEGMELQTLQGASKLIELHRPVLYVQNDRPKNADALIRYMDSIDYSMYWHIAPLFYPDNFAKNSKNVFGDLVSRNVLAFHKSIKINMEGFEPVAIPPAS